MAKNDTLIILNYIPPVKESAQINICEAWGEKLLAWKCRMKKKTLRAALEWCDNDKTLIRVLMSPVGIYGVMSISGICMADSHPLIAVAGILWTASGFWLVANKYKKH